jgi:hypothetical protein
MICYVSLCATPATTVVVVLSLEYIQKPHPMEELQLLLDAMRGAHQQEGGEPAAMRGRLLPVWYLPEKELLAAIRGFRAPDQDELHRKWADALESIYGITAVRSDQVRSCWMRMVSIHAGLHPPSMLCLGVCHTHQS